MLSNFQKEIFEERLGNDANLVFFFSEPGIFVRHGRFLFSVGDIIKCGECGRERDMFLLEDGSWNIEGQPMRFAHELEALEYLVTQFEEMNRMSLGLMLLTEKRPRFVFSCAKPPYDQFWETDSDGFYTFFGAMESFCKGQQ